MIEGFFWGFVAGMGVAVLIDYWTRDRTLEKPGTLAREMEEAQMRHYAAQYQDLVNAIPMREIGTPLPPLGWKTACPPGVWKAYDNEPR